jgi:hypothetical protein
MTLHFLVMFGPLFPNVIFPGLTLRADQAKAGRKGYLTKLQ